MANEVIKAMVERRSIREYKPDMVPQEKIDEIIKAGLYAASGMDFQPAIIIEVTDRKLRDRLSEMNREIGSFPEGSDPFYGAPVVLIVLAEKDKPNRVYDGSLVIGNMMLAAHSLGLGSCWIHRAKEEFETEEGKQILKDLGVEGDYEGIGHCIIGYPAVALPEASPRHENRVYYAK
jgi:nitroreductase